MGILIKIFPKTHHRKHKMNGWVRHILLSSLWIVYLSCAEPVFYEQFQTIDSQWDKNKEYFFTYQIEDHSASYTMSLEIRNNNLYPYQNIWFFCSETQPEGTVLRDTIECVLADDFGKWYGTGISIYHLRLPIRKQHLFPQPGQYTFSIRQGMRDERLKGIEQIGLCIEKDL